MPAGAAGVAPAERCYGQARFEVQQPPFSDGRLHLRVDLTDDRGEQRYHSVDDALVFVVYPPDGARGLVRLEGRWLREEIPAAAELESV